MQRQGASIGCLTIGLIFFAFMAWDGITRGDWIVSLIWGGGTILVALSLLAAVLFRIEQVREIFRQFRL